VFKASIIQKSDSVGLPVHPDLISTPPWSNQIDDTSNPELNDLATNPAYGPGVYLTIGP
jgi:hypothetical protein